MMPVYYVTFTRHPVLLWAGEGNILFSLFSFFLFIVIRLVIKTRYQPNDMSLFFLLFYCHSASHKDKISAE